MEEGTLVEKNIDISEFKPGLYTYFKCYKQLEGKILVNL